MRTLLTTLFALAPVFLFAQRYCGFDQLHALQHSHPGMQEQEALINERILERSLTGDRDDELLVIPVVVHIIHENGEENISDAQVGDAIDHLNQAFANADFFDNMDGTVTDIQFCLASRDPEGLFTTGINRVENAALTDALVPSEEADLKALSFWDSELYLNIWVVKEITREADNAGVVGFATFPTAHGSAMDGIVCEAAFFGSNEVNSTVHVHEAGHYLGLYHTFQGGCPNDDCLLSGDLVCDTPPDADVFNTFCNDGTNSCETDEDDESENNPFRPEALGGIGDQLDMQTNFMDYSNLACFQRFTEGQRERMRASILEIRASLLDGLQCVPPCEDPINVSVSTTPLDIEVGGTVSFTNLSSNYTGAVWLVDGEENGSFAFFEFDPEEQGTYIVELNLTNGDPGCEVTETFIVNVICPVTATYTFTETSIPEGGSIELINTSTGADSYQWYLDGEPVSTDTNFNYTFDDLGGFSITLEALGATCSVFSTTLFVSVGTCTSGKEANIWHHFNTFGSNFGFDFNTDPVSFLPDNNIPAGSAHCKTTLCDANGNLLFISTGTEVLNRDYEVMPNGADLLGHPSSHFGTMIVEKPGSDTEFYVFTSAAESNFEQGVRWSVIDVTLDGGYGDVTDKNVFIELTEQETITCVRHCNLVDFWLVLFDRQEDVYKSYLVNQDGVSESPVESPIGNETSPFSTPIVPSAKGDLIAHGNKVMGFDAATGTLTEVFHFGGQQALGYEFSANGKYLYYWAGEFSVDTYQINLDFVNEADPTLNAYLYDVVGTPVYFFPSRAPDGNIYVEDVFTNNIARILDPNLPGEMTTFEQEFNNANSLINSFGNYFHSYVSGKTLFIEGPANVCQGQTIAYNIYGHECIQDVIDWNLEGDAVLTDNGDGTIEITFPTEGSVHLTAMLNSDCGEVNDLLEINIGPETTLDLGPDFGMCTGGSIPVLDAGDEYDYYLWTTGEVTQTIQAGMAGTYGVTVENGFCQSYDEVEITESFVTGIDLGPDFELCDGSVMVISAGEGYNDYVWQDGTPGPEFTVYEGGSYWVTATIPCFASDTVAVDDCGQVIVGVEELDWSAGLSLFPNPNDGRFSVAFGSPVFLNSWSLRSSEGRLVASKEITSWTEGIEVREQLAAGSYVLTLESDAGILRRRVVIK